MEQMHFLCFQDFNNGLKKQTYRENAGRSALCRQRRSEPHSGKQCWRPSLPPSSKENKGRARPRVDRGFFPGSGNMRSRGPDPSTSQGRPLSTAPLVWGREICRNFGLVSFPGP